MRPTKSWVSTGLKKYGLAYEMKRCQIEYSNDNESNEELDFIIYFVYLVYITL